MNSSWKKKVMYVYLFQTIYVCYLLCREITLIKRFNNALPCSSSWFDFDAAFTFVSECFFISFQTEAKLSDWLIWAHLYFIIHLFERTCTSFYTLLKRCNNVTTYNPLFHAKFVGNCEQVPCRLSCHYYQNSSASWGFK
jgi:uncharacterized membrane protein YjfL (UPF0719 family)